MLEEKRIFDFVLVVGLKEKKEPKSRGAGSAIGKGGTLGRNGSRGPSSAGGTTIVRGPVLQPRIKYQYPNRVSERTQTQLFDHIKEFCFPDTSEFVTAPKIKIRPEWLGASDDDDVLTAKGETFSFVLTESNSEKRWGYCRRFTRKRSRFPICFCVVSFLPCFSIFSKIIDQLPAFLATGGNRSTGRGTLRRREFVRDKSQGKLWREKFSVFLKAIYEQPLPAPGDTLVISYCLPPAKDTQQNFSLTRPDDVDSLLDHVNFEPLLHYVHVPHPHFRGTNLSCNYVSRSQPKILSTFSSRYSWSEESSSSLIASQHYHPVSRLALRYNI